MAFIRFGKTRQHVSWVRWLRETRSSCRFVWVYVPGMIGPPTRWYPSFRALTPGEKCLAATIEVRHPPSVYGSGMGGRRRWRIWSEQRARDVGRILREVQQEQPYPVGVIADDFACRIIMHLADSPNPVMPAFLILNNPMLGTGSLANPLFDCPGYVRSTAFPWDQSNMELWNLDFDLASRVVGELVADASHDAWMPKAMGSLPAAVASPRSVRSWV